MAVALVRSLILYFLVMFLYRVMGKRQIGEMQPGELVLAIMISDIASVPMQSVSVPLMHGVVPILALMCAEVVLSFAAQKSHKLRKLITGEPSLIIANGRLLIQEMERLRFNLDDLFEQLRNSGQFDINEVAFAVLETNGMLSVLPKNQNKTVTLRDMNLKGGTDSFPTNIIKDGEIDYHALARIRRDEAWLKQKLKEKGVRRAADVFLLCADAERITFLQEKRAK